MRLLLILQTRVRNDLLRNVSISQEQFLFPKVTNKVLPLNQVKISLLKKSILRTHLFNLRQDHELPEKETTYLHLQFYLRFIRVPLITIAIYVRVVYKMFLKTKPDYTSK